MRDLLNVRELRVGFGGVDYAVDGISFTIRRGESFCLVGESGSGKSVSALSIARLLPHSAALDSDGEIEISLHEDSALKLNNMTDTEMREIRGRGVAMVFQEPMSSLNPVMTIGEQLLEVLELHRPSLAESDARQTVMDSLESVQITNPEQRLNEYPHRLSGGQRQRVMIAMAMLCQPKLLIADEPTTALDVTVQAEILALLKQLQIEHGMSLLFITHDFGVVAQVADRVAVMRSGQIVELGEVEAVLGSPKHEYTRQLLTALPRHRPRGMRPQGVTRSNDSKPLLSVEGLSVHFPVRAGVFRRQVGSVKAVSNVSMEIERGEIVALVGESGCGKTTLGRAILGLVGATEGRICLESEELARNRSRRARSQIQCVFQDPDASLNPRMLVADALTEPMVVHGVGADDADRRQIACRLLEQVRLDADALDRYPHEFSGGQRQRISIARALCFNPALIVCDEMTSALDVSVQAEILDLLLALRDEHQLALLFITHDIGVVEYIADRVVVMRAGQVVERGTVSQVCAQPSHGYTQALMASVPAMPSYTWRPRTANQI